MTIAAVLVIVAVAGLVTWRRFGGDEPAEAALSTTAPSTGGSVAPTDGFDGTWTVDADSGSFGTGT